MGLVDFTNPSACKWFQDKLEELIDIGVDSFKTDFGERIPTNVVYFDGSNSFKMHNYYTHIYNKVVFELLEKKLGKSQAVVFARSATVGGQQFPIYWGGDNEATYSSMAETLRGGLSFGLSGFSFWSHDIGGFESAGYSNSGNMEIADSKVVDIYKRWTQFGLLSSHSGYHGSDQYKVPWVYDEEAVEVTRKFTKLKCSLMPYIFKNSINSVEHGLPLMRPMLVEFMEDETCHHLDRQYMFGEDILVAPIFNENGKVKYYLPKGKWTNYLDNRVLEGGQWHSETHNYMTLPLMVRENTIIIEGSINNTTSYNYGENPIIHIFELTDKAKTEIFNIEAKKTADITIIKEGNKIKVTTDLNTAYSIVLRNINEVKLMNENIVKTDIGIKIEVSGGNFEIELLVKKGLIKMYLGIDLGTSGVKITAVNEKGEIKASVTREYLVHYSNNGWSDQNPLDWINGVKDGLKEIFQLVDKESVKGIGISGQMHGLVVLGENKEVLYPVILWNDQRTVEESEYLNNEIGMAKLVEYTSNISFTGFTASKLLWLRKNESKIFEKIRHIMLPKDYIGYILTGKFYTDVSDASGTLFFDVKNRKWSKEMIDILGIKEEYLPKIYESHEIIGTLNEDILNEYGINHEVKVAAGGGDNACGAIGAGVVDEDKILISLGTSGVVFIPQEKWSLPEKNSMHTFCDSSNKYHFMGVILSAASCLKWWIEEIQNGDYKKLLEEAENSPLGSKNLFFLPYLTGERTPHSDPFAKGCFIGLSAVHTKGDMTRAVIEGISFALYDSYRLIDDLQPEIIRIIGGGAKAELTRRILTDIFNIKSEVLAIQEGPSYGAAILAMFGVENEKNMNEKLKEIIKVTDTLSPNLENHKEYMKRYKVYTRLYTALKSEFIEISKL